MTFSVWLENLVVLMVNVFLLSNAVMEFLTVKTILMKKTVINLRRTMKTTEKNWSLIRDTITEQMFGLTSEFSLLAVSTKLIWHFLQNFLLNLSGKLPYQILGKLLNVITVIIFSWLLWSDGEDDICNTKQLINTI